jgi:glutaredoxin
MGAPQAEPPAFTVVGYTGCGYFDRAVEACEESGTTAAVIELVTRGEFHDWLATTAPATARGHRTSPAVFAGEPSTAEFIGGCDDLLSRLGMEAEEMDMTGTLSPAAVQAKFHDLQEQHSFVIYVLWRGLW